METQSVETGSYGDSDMQICHSLTHSQKSNCVCITGKASVDNTEWVSSTCHSNVSDEKLPVYLKANKMDFPVKPECLNFTPLKCLCIPLLQIIL